VPFNGTGMFVRLRNWVADAAAGVKIRADYHDIEDDGFADGLSQCIAKDGQTTIMQNIPFNSKRITALSDPVDLQDASTKAYADTKIARTGDASLTGNLTVSGAVSTGSTMTATGYKTRTGTTGTYGTSFFNFDYVGSNLDAWADTTKIGTLATQAFATAADTAAAALKVNRAGDTMTGGLTVNGLLLAAQSIMRFQTASGGYIQWTGGGSYALGGGGTIWHSGNLSPVTNVRLTNGGDAGVSTGMIELSGAVISGVAGTVGGGMIAVTSVRFRYVQFLTPAGWLTAGFA
jgi:hypothetical protein